MSVSGVFAKAGLYPSFAAYLRYSTTRVAKLLVFTEYCNIRIRRVWSVTKMWRSCQGGRRAPGLHRPCTSGGVQQCQVEGLTTTGLDKIKQDHTVVDFNILLLNESLN